MNKRLLTFEVVGDGELEIHGSAEGLRDLIRSLTNVLETGQHDHLMTPSWGGTELSEEPQRAGAKLINKVTIRAW
ncbi:MAG TPA: Imm32 family immunity protein [Myxococcaceae bacterium]|nr:Imm32 family immunity protein [Myxococcaceae bacterium]